jgi:dienelactone hydrolase
MSLGKQIGPEFQAFDFTHGRRTYEVFRGGSGPAILVLHEIPGLHPGVIDFARRLIAAGYTVYLPSLFGRPAAPANGRESVRSILRVCVAREFTKLADRTSPVVGWLLALAASAYRECGGPGVGVVGMCFTGGFALATAHEPSVVASVMSQPAMPAPIGQRGRAALGLDGADLCTITERVNDDLRVLGLRFTNDRGLPAGALRDPASDARGSLRGDRDRLFTGQRGRHRAVGTLGAHGLPRRRTGASDPGRPRPGPGVPGRATASLIRRRRDGCRRPAQGRGHRRRAGGRSIRHGRFCGYAHACQGPSPLQRGPSTL